MIETQNDVAAVELDRATVWQMIVDRTRSLTGADGAVIEMVEGNQMVYRSASGTMTPHLGLRLAIDSSLSGHCATTGELLCCDDAEADPRADRAACLRLNVRSMVLVPLAHGGRVAGVLKVVSSKPNDFGARSVSGLRLMAGLLASAMSHAAEFEAKQALLAERTAALAALRETEERFRGAFECAAIGMALVGLDGRWIKVNASLCRMLDLAEAELLATTFQAITHPDDLDADLAHAAQLVAGEIPSYRMAKRYLSGDGSVVWAQLSVSLVRDRAGRPLYFVSQVQDVTEARRKEAFEADQRAVLERIAQDRPLHEALCGLAEMVERQVSRAWASVMLLHDGEFQQVGPSLPPDLARALGRRPLSFAAGLSRGFPPDGRSPAVSDVATDPAWAALRGAAAAHGVRQSWAVPIPSADGIPLGVLAVHCWHGRPPTSADAETLAAAARLATVATSTSRRRDNWPTWFATMR